MLFTYIPGISAKSIGINYQLSKMITLAKQLKAYDEASGKLKTDVLDNMSHDDIRWHELVSCYSYLSSNIGEGKMLNEYGEYSSNQYIMTTNDEECDDCFTLKTGTYKPKYVDCGNYHYLLKEADTDTRRDGTVTVSIGSRVILKEKINISKTQEAYKADGYDLQLSDDVFLLRNDSVMVTLYHFTYDGKAFGNFICGDAFSTLPIEK